MKKVLSMKKVFSVLIGLLLISGVAFATMLPDNIEHDISDQSFVSTATTVAATPTCSSANNGWIVSMTDAANATDCTTGSGSTTNVCVCDGTNYVDVT